MANSTSRNRNFFNRIYSNLMKPSDLIRFRSAVEHRFQDGLITERVFVEHSRAIQYVLALKAGSNRVGRPPRRVELYR